MAEVSKKSFEVRNEDVSIRFSCKNYGKHLDLAIKNLCDTNKGGNPDNINAHFASEQNGVEFWFDGEKYEGQSFMREAVFFENTEYPLRVKAISDGVKIDSLYIAGHSSDAASDGDEEDDPLIYGTLNFHNQVGRTDISINYHKNGKPGSLTFRTEVLSYKMDYRSDMQTIIKDIEEEYSMLSYSFLKQTYLSFKQKKGVSTDLLWWQVFQQEYEKIIDACKIIINSPKRRLKSEVRNERAERLQFIDPVLENEYIIHQQDPHHLYRTEEMILSKDTVENRFLKYVMKEILRRFSVVKEHIKNTLKVTEKDIADNLEQISDNLQRIVRHPFFKQIGVFKGFSQDSLVMKRARGYSDIYRSWLILQSGFELEDDIHHLEVKDISELYEIWCFIKVKNMVADILGKDAIPKSSGKELTSGFIRQLVYGSQSEVKFYKDEVELATVIYNAQVEEDENSIASAIDDTSTFTTTQRPDIVLRLSKRSDDDIVYTYLFDAKYRLSDKPYRGDDVPPVDAINQMHRYRDAIYYNSGEDEEIKREVVGGYVLYPGNLSADEVKKSYYHQSHERIGIGAFPLKPGAKYLEEDGSLILDPSSSEAVLKSQIEEWLRDNDRKQHLLDKTIPQKGLYYSDEPIAEGCFFVSYIDSHVNDNISELVSGTSSLFVSGYQTLINGVNIHATKYLAVLDKDRVVHGFYRINDIKIVNMGEMLEAQKNDPNLDGRQKGYKGYDYPYRVQFELGEYKMIDEPFVYGLPNAFSGVVMKKALFKEYCNGMHSGTDQLPHRI